MAINNEIIRLDSHTQRAVRSVQCAMCYVVHRLESTHRGRLLSLFHLVDVPSKFDFGECIPFLIDTRAFGVVSIPSIFGVGRNGIHNLTYRWVTFQFSSSPGSLILELGYNLMNDSRYDAISI